MPTVFFAFREAPERRAALRARESLDRYRLFGLDEIAHRARVQHNLEAGDAPGWARAANRVANAAVPLGGDFAAVLPSLRRANAADVVFATVDTVGIPLLWLRRARLLRTPVVYASIGLAERFARMRSSRARRAFADALRGAHAITAYALSEVEELRAVVGPGGPSVVFIPFGVDADAFRPDDREPDIDVLTVGADPLRDFELLLETARRRGELRFHVVTTAERLRTLEPLPENMTAETDLPLESVRERYARARVVALPVRQNSYSGATTTLLQAMAMAKPVVVSHTDAIARGYELFDAVNCRLVPPGDVDAFERVLAETTTGADASISLGIRARETVLRSFSWERYTNALWELLSSAT